MLEGSVPLPSHGCPRALWSPEAEARLEGGGQIVAANPSGKPKSGLGSRCGLDYVIAAAASAGDDVDPVEYAAACMSF